MHFFIATLIVLGYVTGWMGISAGTWALIMVTLRGQHMRTEDIYGWGAMSVLFTPVMLPIAIFMFLGVRMLPLMTSLNEHPADRRARAEREALEAREREVRQREEKLARLAAENERLRRLNEDDPS
jgi:hypothetical protein